MANNETLDENPDVVADLQSGEMRRRAASDALQAHAPPPLPPGWAEEAERQRMGGERPASKTYQQFIQDFTSRAIADGMPAREAYGKALDEVEKWMERGAVLPDPAFEGGRASAAGADLRGIREQAMGFRAPDILGGEEVETLEEYAPLETQPSESDWRKAFGDEPVEGGSDLGDLEDLRELWKNEQPGEVF